MLDTIVIIINFTLTNEDGSKLDTLEGFNHVNQTRCENILFVFVYSTNKTLKRCMDLSHLIFVIIVFFLSVTESVSYSTGDWKSYGFPHEPDGTYDLHPGRQTTSSFDRCVTYPGTSDKL